MRIVSSLILATTLALALAPAAGCASNSDEILAQDDGEPAEGDPGRFTLWQSGDGEHRFHLAAAGGEVLLMSAGYTSRTGAINGILSVQENGVDPARYALVPTDGGTLIHLVAANHQTIAFSKVHATEASATRAIAAAVGAITAYLDRRAAVDSGARFEMIADAAGRFRFHVLDAGGGVLVASEAYTTEAAAYNGAIAVQLAGATSAGYSVRQTAAGAYYFVIQAGNGQVVGTSGTFAARQDADAAIARLVTLLPTLAVL